MIIGVPKEIKKDEYRVALLPVGADLLTKDGHTVLLEREAGLSSGFDDQAYASVGAEIVESAEEIYRRSELVVKRGNLNLLMSWLAAPTAKDAMTGNGPAS